MLAHWLGYQIPQPYGYAAAGISLLLLLAVCWLGALIRGLRA